VSRSAVTLTVILLALGTVAFTTGASGDSGRGASAWAFVDPAGPALVGARSNGFTAVSSPATGVYCLSASAGTKLDDKAPVASQEASRSAAIGWPLVRLADQDSNCAAGQLEVKTFDSNTAPTDKVAFTVVVP
jgi:hypothetical protein